MLNFTFKNQTEILFGKGQLSEVSSRLPKQAKVLFLYGGGSIKKNGIYDKVTTALAGAEVIEFQGVEPNPEFETLMKAVNVARENDVNFILAVGGGSVIDGATAATGDSHAALNTSEKYRRTSGNCSSYVTTLCWLSSAADISLSPSNFPCTRFITKIKRSLSNF